MPGQHSNKLTEVTSESMSGKEIVAKYKSFKSDVS